ncbi:hypothetical protein [Microbacterium sp. PAMC 28756]|uniref:hypothetical protein n=1 Tax=Microbacterium sp. PAMC 28756 TaxID=1795053 RepID=UPI000AAA640B|nr:hypothetical protein [Microbacterium sp. PAMC 28756]
MRSVAGAVQALKLPSWCARLRRTISPSGSALNDVAAERMAPLVLLGPDAVSDGYVALIDAMSPPEAMDRDRVNAAESALTAAMRAALGVSA